MVDDDGNDAENFAQDAPKMLAARSTGSSHVRIDDERVLNFETLDRNNFSELFAQEKEVVERASYVRYNVVLCSCR